METTDNGNKSRLMSNRCCPTSDRSLGGLRALLPFDANHAQATRMAEAVGNGRAGSVAAVDASAVS